MVSEAPRSSRAEPIQRLILELGRLPGIGERSAARLAYYILRASQRQRQQAQPGPSLAQDLAEALMQAHNRISFCNVCQDLSGAPICHLCADGRRDTSTICVVEQAQDLRALEMAGVYRGTYHVLHGVLSPLEGIGPDALRVRELLQRLRSGTCQEVIVATNSNVEGDATALYLAGLLRPLGVRVTRPASGIPLGGELEFLDQGTLGRALAERRDV